MKLSKLTYASGSKEDFVKDIFEHQYPFYDIQFGTAFLIKGRKTPIEGDFTKHDQHKIVCILEGKVQLILEKTKDTRITLNPGDVFEVEKYEGHSGIALEDTKLIYVMFGKKETAEEL